jgi:hyperosmotically inducible periplasmic protein
MIVSKQLIVTVAFAGFVLAVPACSPNARQQSKEAGDAIAADTKAGADKAADATKNAAQDAASATKEAGHDIADETKDIAGKTADKTKEVGGAVTDGWITAKVKTKFVDESVLKGSDINVDTSNHVVTLKGTVMSTTAKTRAETIARGTDGVTGVVNQLVVK